MAIDNRHRVYMSFMDRSGWQCQFLEADLKTPLPRKLTFASPGKVVVAHNQVHHSAQYLSRIALSAVNR
jgi:hypothetical protein